MKSVDPSALVGIVSMGICAVSFMAVPVPPRYEGRLISTYVLYYLTTVQSYFNSIQSTQELSPLI